MQHLQINNLTFKYQDIDIFTNLNFSFTNGWTGIIGTNGSGKTTLLKLISKKLKPHFGIIIGNDLFYYCNQKMDSLPDKFEEFRDDYSSKKYKLEELLSIEDEWLYRWESLSYGEKKRIQIAIALYSETDILLLDEPTNHLDILTKKIVINALKKFDKIGIIVSHDREILDSLCTNTVIIKNKNFYKYNTSYSNATLEFEKEQNSLKKEFDKQNQKILSLQKTIQTQKEKVSQSKSKFSKKNIDKKDKSSKEKINLAKLTGKDKNDSKKVDIFNTKLEQLNSQKIILNKEYKKGIIIENSSKKHNLLPFSLKSNSIKLSDEKTLFFPDIFINKGDKIALLGDNGVGKSSFINYLISHLNQEDIFFLPQEIDAKNEKELFENISNLSDEKKGEIFTLVTRLSSNPKNLLNNQTPSSGELKKLLFAKALLENIDFMILDEPTNHMDIDSIISFQEALEKYKGTVLFISHDKFFIERIQTKTWNILKKTASEFYIKI